MILMYALTSVAVDGQLHRRQSYRCNCLSVPLSQVIRVSKGGPGAPDRKDCTQLSQSQTILAVFAVAVYL